jgi:hypothetical protein
MFYFPDAAAASFTASAAADFVCSIIFTLFSIFCCSSVERVAGCFKAPSHATTPATIAIGPTIPTIRFAIIFYSSN